MNDFEHQLDEIRIKLFNETKGMNKEVIIDRVNSNAKKIACEFEIKIESSTNNFYIQAMHA